MNRNKWMARNLALTGCVGILATMVACSDDSTTPAAPVDGSVQDGAVSDSAAADSRTADAPPGTDAVAPGDGSTTDVNVADTGTADAVVADAGVADTGMADTNVADTNVADTNVADTNVADTNVADTNVADTVVADTNVADTNAADTNVADTSISDTSVGDTSVGDTSVSDSGGRDGSSMADVTSGDGGVQPPPPLNMCATLDSFWSYDRENLSPEWALWISGGPTQADAPGYGYAGFTNMVIGDCRVENIINSNDPTAWDTYVNEVTDFAQAFFGCPIDSGTAPRPFPLIPSYYQGPLTKAELQVIGEWWVSAITWAVSEQSMTNGEAVLTGDQITQIEAEIAYDETLYPTIVDSTALPNSICPSTDAGGD